MTNGKKPSEREKADRTFRDEAGTLEPRVMLDVTAVVFRFPHTGEELVMKLADLGPLPPPGVLRAAAAFGINTSVGNVLGSVTDRADFHDACAARWETLISGSWSSDREFGPRIGHLIEAISRIKTRKDGMAPSKEWTDALRAKISAPDFDRKAYLANDSVKAEIDKIKVEQLQARIAQAERSGSSDLGSILD